MTLQCHSREVIVFENSFGSTSLEIMRRIAIGIETAGGVLQSHPCECDEPIWTVNCNAKADIQTMNGWGCRDGVRFNLPHSPWLDLLGTNLQAPTDG